MLGDKHQKSVRFVTLPSWRSIMTNWKEIVSAMLAEVFELRTRGINPAYLITTLDVLEAMVFNESAEDEDVESWYELIAAVRRQINKEVDAK